MVGYHKGLGPLGQNFQTAACMTLVALVRKVEVPIGERMVVEREDVRLGVGVGVEVDPAAGRRKMTA